MTCAPQKVGPALIAPAVTHVRLVLERLALVNRQLGCAGDELDELVHQLVEAASADDRGGVHLGGAKTTERDHRGTETNVQINMVLRMFREHLADELRHLPEEPGPFASYAVTTAALARYCQVEPFRAAPTPRCWQRGALEPHYLAARPELETST